MGTKFRTILFQSHRLFQLSKTGRSPQLRRLRSPTRLLLLGTSPLKNQAKIGKPMGATGQMPLRSSENRGLLYHAKIDDEDLDQSQLFFAFSGWTLLSRTRYYFAYPLTALNKKLVFNHC